MQADQPARIAVIGFGEAGQAFAAGWQAEGANPIAAFDVKGAFAELGVMACPDRAAALAGATHVFCLVTADQALIAAGECAPYLPPDVFWFDGNSCAPGTKRAAAKRVAAAGGRYVDTAIMAPVHPRRHKTPILLSGPHAAEAAPGLRALGMQVSLAGPGIGDASTIKMLRSVMIKGMEALSAECFLAARKAGVDAAVLASLTGSNPEIDWPLQGAYNLERMMNHGLRRAAEMREVVATLQDLGLAGTMASAVADWQQRIGQMGLKGAPGDLAARSDLILNRL